MAKAGARSPEIRQIMAKLGRGPDALSPTIGKALNESEPAWETIQGQSKEYVRFTSDLAKYDPPKGTKESWTEQTAEYAKLARELDRAADAQDKPAALAAHGQLTNSCMGCHRQHRAMMGPGMMGGPGGPPGGGLPPGR